MAKAQDYSPAELLQFGQKAEADGNLDYALRVFAYLANNFPDTVEGEIGFDGYNRIEACLDRAEARPERDPLWEPDRARPQAAAQQPQAAAPRPEAAPQKTSVVTPNTRVTSSRMSEATRRQLQPAPLTDRLASLHTRGEATAPTPAAQPERPQPSSPASADIAWLREAATAPPRTQAPAVAEQAAAGRSIGEALREQSGAVAQRDTVHNGSAWGSSAADDGDMALPRMVARALEESEGNLEDAFQRRYRAGTAIAIVFAVLGWLLLACGIALMGISLSGSFPELAAIGFSGIVPTGIEAGLAALSAGLVLVFVAQVGSAIFDNANATRHLLAIERAKAGY